jgi:hypothetical protein
MPTSFRFSPGSRQRGPMYIMTSANLYNSLSYSPMGSCPRFKPPLKSACSLPAIYVSYCLVDIPPGIRVSFLWIVEEVLINLESAGLSDKGLVFFPTIYLSRAFNTLFGRSRLFSSRKTKIDTATNLLRQLAVIQKGLVSLCTPPIPPTRSPGYNPSVSCPLFFSHLRSTSTLQHTTIVAAR